MVAVSVNGQEFEFEYGTTGAGLLKRLQIPASTVVVELNKEIMQREQFLEYKLADGDSMELVTLVGGG